MQFSKLYRRLKYPYDLIHALMEYLPGRCCVCDCPATRQIKMKLIIGDIPYFCDDHGGDDKEMTRASWQPYEYIDLGEQAVLVRACKEYLNNVEQKT
jgi:hypothetical protein